MTIKSIVAVILILSIIAGSALYYEATAGVAFRGSNSNFQSSPTIIASESIPHFARINWSGVSIQFVYYETIPFDISSPSQTNATLSVYGTPPHSWIHLQSSSLIVGPQSSKDQIIVMGAQEPMTSSNSSYWTEISMNVKGLPTMNLTVPLVPSGVPSVVLQDPSMDVLPSSVIVAADSSSPYP